MKKILFLTLLFLVFLPSSVKGDCDDSEEIRLQKLARNVMVSYVYKENNDTFTVTLSNLNKDLEVLEVDEMKRYNVIGDLNINNQLSGRHSYIIYSKNPECSTDELVTKYVSLPYRNPYYSSEECKGMENYSYCSKWINNSLSYDIWHAKITEYKKKTEKNNVEKKHSESTLSILFGKFKKLYSEYYYIILPVIILTLVIMIAIKNKKDSLV